MGFAATGYIKYQLSMGLHVLLVNARQATSSDINAMGLLPDT